MMSGMAPIPDYEGCAVFVYDQENNRVAEAVILDHNRRDHIIRISHTLDNVRSTERLNLLIVHPEEVNEYSGTLRSIIAGSRELALFRQRPRQGREAIRHEINETAMASIVDAKLNPVSDAVQVTVVNMSTSGAMIKTNFSRLKVGDSLEIKMNFGGTESLLHAKIVRDRYVTDGVAEFGCKFIFG